MGPCSTSAIAKARELAEGWLDYLAPQLYWPIASEAQPITPNVQYSMSDPKFQRAFAAIGQTNIKRLLAYSSTRRNGADTDIYVIDPRRLPQLERNCIPLPLGLRQRLPKSPPATRIGPARSWAAC